jgi:hypothetical protein
MKTMFGREALADEPAGAELADPLPLLPPVLHDAATSAPTSATVANLAGFRSRLPSAFENELPDVPRMGSFSQIVN